MSQIVTVNTDPEVVRGGDGGLAHVPVVPGVPSEAPDLPVLALAPPHVDVQWADTMAVHVGPEPQTQRAPTGLAGGGELLTLQQGGVTWQQ